MSSVRSKSPPRSGGGKDGTLDSLAVSWPLVFGAVLVKDGDGPADLAKRVENGDSFSPHIGDGGVRAASLFELLAMVWAKSEIDNACESNPWDNAERYW
jgi:hypothetical protein